MNVNSHTDDPAQRILDRLSAVTGKPPHRQHDGKWTAHCPGHDDRHPSLSITEKDDGTILLNCFAGCTTEAVLAKIGLKLSDLFPAKSRRRNPPPAILKQVSKSDDSRKPWQRLGVWIRALRRNPRWQRLKLWEKLTLSLIAHDANFGMVPTPWGHGDSYKMGPGEWIAKLRELCAGVFSEYAGASEAKKNRLRNRMWYFLRRMENRDWLAVTALKTEKGVHTNDGLRIALWVPENLQHLFFNTTDSGEDRTSQGDSEVDGLENSTPTPDFSTPLPTPETATKPLPIAAKSDVGNGEFSTSNSTPHLGLIRRDTNTKALGSGLVAPASVPGRPVFVTTRDFAIAAACRRITGADVLNVFKTRFGYVDNVNDIATFTEIANFLSNRRLDIEKVISEFAATPGDHTPGRLLDALDPVPFEGVSV